MKIKKILLLVHVEKLKTANGQSAAKEVKQIEYKKKQKFQEKINKKYPQENLLVLEYTGAKNPTKIKCLECDTEYSLKRGEGFLSKNKQCVCVECHNKIKKYNSFVNKLKEKYPRENLKVINFIDRRKPCDIVCTSCGNKIHYTYASNALQRLSICKKCYPIKEELRNNTKQQFLNYLENHKEWFLLENLDKIKSIAHKTIACKCLYCGRVNYKTVYDYMRGRQCFCQTTTEPKTQEIFESCLEDDYELISPYANIYSKVKIRHKACGFIYETAARNCWKNGGRCPRCHKKQSKGEKKIIELLDNLNIEYIREYPIRIKGHLLRIDFYIPSKHIFIEYQGVQHYQPIDHFGGIERFKKQQQYDKYKEDFLKDKLFIISYKEDIEQVLNQILQSSTTTRDEVASK